MDETSLPRELQLIIDDIVEQDVHLLEWEVFGNTTEDMRVVLTWRRIELAKKGKKSKWKLHSSPLGVDRDVEDAAKQEVESKDGKKGKMDRKGGKEFEEAEDEKADYIKDYLEGEKVDEEEKNKLIADETDGTGKGEEHDANTENAEAESQEGTEDVAQDEGDKTIDGENEGDETNIMNSNEESEESRKAKLLEEENNRLNKSVNLEDEEEEIDLNAKKPRTKEQATRMLQMQRSKFQLSIDQSNLDEEEINKRFPNGIYNAIYGEDYDPSLKDEQNWQYNGMSTDGKDWDNNSSRIPGDDGDRDINSSYYTRDGKSIGNDISGMHRDVDGIGMGADLSGKYEGGMGPDIFGMYNGGMGPDIFGMYNGGSEFVYNPAEMASGYEYEYYGKVYQSKKIRKEKLKLKELTSYERRRQPVIRVISECFNTKGKNSVIFKNVYTIPPIPDISDIRYPISNITISDIRYR